MRNSYDLPSAATAAAALTIYCGHSSSFPPPMRPGDMSPLTNHQPPSSVFSFIHAPGSDERARSPRAAQRAKSLQCQEKTLPATFLPAARASQLRPRSKSELKKRDQRSRSRSPLNEKRGSRQEALSARSTPLRHFDVKDEDEIGRFWVMTQI